MGGNKKCHREATILFRVEGSWLGGIFLEKGVWLKIRYMGVCDHMH